MMASSPQRRYLFLAIAFVFLTVVVFYSSSSVDLTRIKNLVPGKDANSSVSTSAAQDSKPTDTAAETEQEEADKQESDPQVPPPLEDTEDKTVETTDGGVKTSKFHYLIPASGNNRRLCFNIVSSAANRYPAPVLVGWNATGLLSAATTHLAKLHAIQRYLDRLPKEEDDDIVLIVDGYDVVMQLPPDIMLQRYYKALESENARNAERFGISVDELYEMGFETTLFFGADKICWPIDWRAPRCWAVPDSTMPSKAFGEKTNNGQMNYLIPKWLNSGTLIGPAAHMRDYIAATLYEILNSYDPKYGHSESDQFYLANVWGRQEYFRSKQFAEDGEVKGGPKDRLLPHIYDKSVAVEYHVGIEYDSAMFQTKAGYEQWNDWIKYNSKDGSSSLPAAKVDKDLKDEKENFKPYEIEMPAEVEKGLRSIYDEIADVHPGTDSSVWIRSVALGTNYITKQVWGLWHVTGDKDVIENQFTKFWFYPYARSLLKSAVRKLQTTDVISSEPIGGRYWVHKTVYPDEKSLTDELGGGWSDEDGGGRWIDYQTMCKEWEEDVLGGEKVASNQKRPAATNLPPPPEKHT